MTVAAGFRFADGVLICADTEITHGAELKEKGTKVFPYSFKKSGNKAIFTFSGDVFASKQCIQAMARAVAALPPNRWSSEELFTCLSESLHAFHHKYIFKHPQYQFGTGLRSI